MKRLSEEIPGISDILRFMVRDTEDPAIVDGFKLDAEFESKYRGILREWAQGQGLTDDVAKRYWRAHWSVPSASQLFEMFHRLRPDKYGGAVDANGFPLATTERDLNLALNQNDVAPAWRGRLTEIAYRVMRQVDARRSFLQNNLSETQLQSHYRDVGLSPPDATALVKVARRTKRDALRNHPSVRAYLRNQISDRGVVAQLLSDNYEMQAIQDTLTWAQGEAQRQSQARCVNALKRRYLSGEIPDDSLQQVLQTQDLGVQQIQRLKGQWQCEKALRPKELSAAQLCKAADRGLITDADFNLRLQRLGYSQAAAAAIVALCQLNRQDRLAKKKPPKKAAAVVVNGAAGT